MSVQPALPAGRALERLFTPGIRLGWTFRDRHGSDRALPRTRSRIPRQCAEQTAERAVAAQASYARARRWVIKPSLVARAPFAATGRIRRRQEQRDRRRPDPGRSHHRDRFRAGVHHPVLVAAGQDGRRPAGAELPEGAGGVAAAGRRSPAGRAGPPGPGARVGQRGARRAAADRRLRRQPARLAGPADHARHLACWPASRCWSWTCPASWPAASSPTPPGRRGCPPHSTCCPPTWTAAGCWPACPRPSSPTRWPRPSTPARRAGPAPSGPSTSGSWNSCTPRWAAGSPRPGWPPPSQAALGHPVPPGLLSPQEEALIGGGPVPGRSTGGRSSPNLVRLDAFLADLARYTGHAPAGPRRRAPAYYTCLALDAGGPQRPRRDAGRAGHPVADRPGVRQPQRPAPAVIIAGADEITRPHLERLAGACERRGVPLTVHVPAPARGHAWHMLGGGTAAFMRLGHHAEAEQAAGYIGRQHKFVLSQFTATARAANQTPHPTATRNGIRRLAAPPPGAGRSSSLGPGSRSRGTSTSRNWSTGSVLGRGHQLEQRRGHASGSTNTPSSPPSCRTSPTTLCCSPCAARPAAQLQRGRMRPRHRHPARRQRPSPSTGPPGQRRPATASRATRLVSTRRSAVQTPLPARDVAIGDAAQAAGAPSRLTPAGGQPGISRPHQARQLARRHCPHPHHRCLRARRHQASWPNRCPHTAVGR